VGPKRNVNTPFNQQKLVAMKKKLNEFNNEKKPKQ